MKKLVLTLFFMVCASLSYAYTTPTKDTAKAKKHRREKTEKKDKKKFLGLRPWNWGLLIAVFGGEGYVIYLSEKRK